MLVINGIELEFDISDYEFMEKFMKTQNKVNGLAQKVDAEKDSIKKIKLTVQMYRTVFDDLYGVETANKLVKKQTSALEWARAFEQMVQYSMEQSKEMNEVTSRITALQVGDLRNARHSIEIQVQEPYSSSYGA